MKIAREPSEQFTPPRPSLPAKEPWVDTRLPPSRRKQPRPWALVLFLPDGLRRIECTFRDYRGARNALLFRRKQGKSGYKVVNTVKDPNLTGEFIP